jgi:hypothetical protein
MQSWADAQWFTDRPEVPRTITVTVFKVPGETNTDDLSPAPDAWSRPDIPLHYLAMLKNTREGAAFKPEEESKRGPMKFIEELKAKGHLVAYVGDVVGTGSSRKSATNSVIWATGQDIPFVPNKRFGGVTLGGKIAPIFFNTQEDSGALPIEVDISKLEMGDVIDHPTMEPIKQLGELAANPRQKLAEYAMEAEAEERRKRAEAESVAAVPDDVDGAHVTDEPPEEVQVVEEPAASVGEPSPSAEVNDQIDEPVAEPAADVTSEPEPEPSPEPALEPALDREVPE